MGGNNWFIERIVMVWFFFGLFLLLFMCFYILRLVGKFFWGFYFYKVGLYCCGEKKRKRRKEVVLSFCIRFVLECLGFFLWVERWGYLYFLVFKLGKKFLFFLYFCGRFFCLWLLYFSISRIGYWWWKFIYFIIVIKYLYF